GAGADESRSCESANGHAQLAPAPPPERPSPVLGAWATGPEHVIEHCHGQLPVFVEEDQRAGARRRTYVAARCGRTASGTMPISLAVGKQPLRLGRSPSMARRECGRLPPRRNAGRHCAKESSHLATLLPSALPPPTLWPRREVIAKAHEFRWRMSQFQSAAFPPTCGKSITVGIDPSSRMQDQFQGAWR